MNKIERLQTITSYDIDYAQWCAEQGALLRSGRVSEIDRDNLTEEIASLGRSDRREIESRLKVLLVYLLKMRFQPERNKTGWKSTIVEQRRRINKLVGESPSLAPYPARILDEEYEYARSDAAEEAGLALEAFPVGCPFTIAQMLDLDYYPEG